MGNSTQCTVLIKSGVQGHGCVSFSVFMNFPVTFAAKRDQVALGILALTAPESLVMDFNRGKRAAGLAAPTVALQYLFA